MFQIVLLKSFSYFCLVPLLCSVQQSNLTSKCVQQLFISLIFTIFEDFFFIHFDVFCCHSKNWSQFSLSRHFLFDFFFFNFALFHLPFFKKFLFTTPQHQCVHQLCYTFTNNSVPCFVLSHTCVHFVWKTNHL